MTHTVRLLGVSDAPPSESPPPQAVAASSTAVDRATVFTDLMLFLPSRVATRRCVERTPPDISHLWVQTRCGLRRRFESCAGIAGCVSFALPGQCREGLK